MVTVTVVTIAPVEEGPLANLLQLYQYDFSEIEPSDVASDGRFHQLDGVACQYAYLVYASGQLAGFALVGRDPYSGARRLRPMRSRRDRSTTWAVASDHFNDSLDDGNGTDVSTRVPLPGSEMIRISPFTSLSRSRIATNPTPAPETVR